MTHQAIADKIDKLFEDPKEASKYATSFNYEKDAMELAYMPIIQSGGNYDIR